MLLQRTETPSIKRFLFMFSLLILGALIVVNGYFMFQQLFQPETEVHVYKQEVVELGKEVALGFKIVNNEGRDLNYTYGISLNITNPPIRGFTESVLVPHQRSFQFVMKFSPIEIDVIKVNITIHKENGKSLIEEATFFIKVSRID